MELFDYLSEFKIPQNAFAKKIGVGYVTLNLILHHKSLPKLSTAIKIQKETYGKVSCEDLYNSFSQNKGKKKQSGSAQDG